jgi:hypothetical protein
LGQAHNHSAKHTVIMTISEEARDVLDEIGADRRAALVAAKAIAQQIIGESEESDQPLSGLVYDVWGLYNEGTPRCRFTSPYENRDLVFAGFFHRNSGEEGFVVRRKAFSQHEMVELLRNSTRLSA